MGYKVTYRLTLKNDGEAEQLMQVYLEFHEKILKPLLHRQRFEKDAIGKNALERHLAEQNEAIRQYFVHLSKPKSHNKGKSKKAV